MIVQNDVQKRLMDADAAVVVDEPELPEPIHKEAHPRACGSNHLGKRLLRYFRDEGLGFGCLAELGHQEQNPRQPLFARVEELVDKISLRANALGQQKTDEHVGESVLLVHHPNHFIAVDLQCSAGRNGGRGCHPHADSANNGFLADEFARGEQRDSSLLAGCRYYGELRASGLKVKNTIRRISLCKKVRARFQHKNLASNASVAKEGGDIEWLGVRRGHL